MANRNVQRDESGKIISYTPEALKGCPGDSFEVLMAKYEARFARLESRTEDAHVKLDKIDVMIAAVQKQTDLMCTQWHEMLGSFGKVVTTNKTLTEACEANILEAMKFKVAVKMFAGIGAFIVGLGGIIIAVIEAVKFFGKRGG